MTVLAAGTRGDAIRVQVAGVDLEQLSVVGTVRGVVPLAVAPRCGPGVGLLAFVPAPAPTLSFQAPGSSSPGAPVTIATDGDFLLEDGTDASKWLRVTVVMASLPGSPAQAPVVLGDRYNEAGPDDVTSAEAAAGDVATFTLSLKNVSPAPVLRVRAWLDPRSSALEISTDGVSWFAPTTEADANALAWASIAAGASVTLHLRRTIAAGAPPSPSELNLIQYAWDGA